MQKLAFRFRVACTVLCLYSIASAHSLNKASLQTVESKVITLVERVLPCTVGLGAEGMPGGGSGVIVNQDGLIMTAAHVTSATGKEITVYFPNGKTVKAKALGANFNRDAGFAQITDEGDYPYVEIGDTKSLKKNQWCVSLGHAGGFQKERTPPIRLGRILETDINGFIRTDCTLIGGDSGGPLFDLEGKLIGIHSNIGMTLSENNHVPSSVFQQDWDRLLKGESWGQLGAGPPPDPNRPVLGVLLGRETENGVVVNVIPDGAAEKAGLKNQDVITSIHGTKIRTKTDILRIIHRSQVGEEVSVVVKRDNEKLTLTVKLIRARDLKPDAEDANEPANSADHPKQPEEPKTDPSTSSASASETSEPKSSEETNNSQQENPERSQNNGEGGILDQVRGFFDRLRPPKDEFYESVLTAYKPIVATASESVVPIYRSHKQIAVATAVTKDGLLVTKASEVKGRKLTVQFEGLEPLPVKVLADFPEHDIAVVKINARLNPISLSVENADPPLGTLIAAAGAKSKTLAIGVVSVLERNLLTAKHPFLGVELRPHKDGLTLSRIVNHSAAQKSGLREGDIVLKLNGKNYKSIEKFKQKLGTMKPGDRIRLEIRRGDALMGKFAKLGARSTPDHLGYPQGGRLSSNRTDYPNAIQTDLAIRPQDCGSPLVDLEGRCLGINIARAGRIKSYAIPADVIQELVAQHVRKKSNR